MERGNSRASARGIANNNNNNNRKKNESNIKVTQIVGDKVRKEPYLKDLGSFRVNRHSTGKCSVA